MSFTTAPNGLYVVEARPANPAVIQQATARGIGVYSHGHLVIGDVGDENARSILGGDLITAWVGILYKDQADSQVKIFLTADQTATVPGYTQIIKKVKAIVPQHIVDALVSGPVEFVAQADTTFAGPIDVIVKLRFHASATPNGAVIFPLP